MNSSLLNQVFEIGGFISSQGQVLLAEVQGAQQTRILVDAKVDGQGKIQGEYYLFGVSDKPLRGIIQGKRL